MHACTQTHAQHRRTCTVCTCRKACTYIHVAGMISSRALFFQGPSYSTKVEQPLAIGCWPSNRYALWRRRAAETRGGTCTCKGAPQHESLQLVLVLTAASGRAGPVPVLVLFFASGAKLTDLHPPSRCRRRFPAFFASPCSSAARDTFMHIQYWRIF